MYSGLWPWCGEDMRIYKKGLQGLPASMVPLLLTSQFPAASRVPGVQSVCLELRLWAP